MMPWFVCVCVVCCHLYLKCRMNFSLFPVRQDITVYVNKLLLHLLAFVVVAATVNFVVVATAAAPAFGCCCRFCCYCCSCYMLLLLYALLGNGDRPTDQCIQ